MKPFGRIVIQRRASCHYVAIALSSAVAKLLSWIGQYLISLNVETAGRMSNEIQGGGSCFPFFRSYIFILLLLLSVFFPFLRFFSIVFHYNSFLLLLSIIFFLFFFFLLYIFSLCWCCCQCYYSFSFFYILVAVLCT